MILGRAIKKFSKLFSDENLTKKAYLNIVSGGLSYIVRLVVVFIITPLLVSGLGSFLFGMWQIINRTVSYITPAGGQPTEALQWMVANQQSSKDYMLKKQLFGSALLVWGFFLPIVIVIGAAISWFLPVWFDVPVEYVNITRITSLILVIGVAIRIFSELPQSILKGENLGYKRIGLTISLSILGGLFTWLALYFDTGLVGVSVAALLSTLLNGILYVVLARVFVPWYGVAKPTKQQLRQFLSLSGWFMGWNLVWISMISLDVVLLGALASVELVTVYTLTKYVPEILISVIQFIITGVTPGIGGIVGKGEYEHAARLRAEMLTMSWLLMTAMGTTVVMWNSKFIGLWVGAQNFAGSLESLLIFIVVFQFVFILNDAVIIDVTLRLNKKVIYGAISSLLTIGFIILFVSVLDLGITGLCLGVILGRLLLSLGYPYLVGKSLQIAWADQLQGVLRPITVSGILFVAAFVFERIISSVIYAGFQGWFLFFTSAGISLVLILILAFLVGLSRNQRMRIISRLKIVAGLS